ncbi:MAG: Tad domain-containing protein [Candidatus Eremiobacteraeota bacterium]|nr:Tad domain-containing protein [Candidatus Eremiobacteraeota bacterium]
MLKGESSMHARLAERGTVLPFVAICMAVLAGFAGLAVDVGYWEYQQRQQQSATDAAAIGGAQQLLYAGCNNQSAANTAGQKDASENGFANGGNTTVTIANPAAFGSYAGQSCAVSARIKTTKVASFFTRYLGQSKGVTETTAAVATLSANNDGCIYLLSSGSSSTINGDNVQAPKCGILINDTATFNGSTVNAYSIGYAGGAPIENGSSFTQAAPKPMLPIADPCPEIVGCSYLTANPPSTASCSSYNANGLTAATMTPGCYNSVLINGSSVTMQPGVYVFNGSTTFNGSTIAGSGVTIYVTASGTPPDFNGNNVNITPPTSGSYNGVLYYQVPSNAQAPIFNGSSVNFEGLIYAPGAINAVFNGANGNYLVLVFGSTIFNGSGAFDFGAPPAGGSLIRQAVLVQ